MSIFLHVGLPKTASTYLQKFVFPNISSKELIYDPPKILQEVHDLLIAPKLIEEELYNAKFRVDRELNKWCD